LDKELLIKLKEKGFDKQRAVIRDKSKRIALFVGRRGAKTSTIVIMFLMFAMLHKKIRLVFIGLTGEQAENAFLPHATQFLESLDIYEGPNYSYNKTERLFTFLDTNSTISLKGYDTSYKEMDKILGGNCFAVAIDECQSQTQDIEKAILYKIQQAVSDHLPHGGGIIILAGTAGDYMGDNMWYRLCSTPNHLGWSFHTWLDKENPYMLAAKLMEDADFEQRYGPDFRELDWYKQQYLNQWITSGKRLVYQLTNKNLLGMPECQGVQPSAQFMQDAIFGLGMDFGFSPDPMAFLVVAYNPRYSDKLYVIEEYKQTEMYISDVDAKITQLSQRYKFNFMVADAGAQAKAQVADLNQNYGRAIIAADKAGKYAHQNTINSDFRSGHILIDPIACPQLINEMQNLIWDPIKLNTQNKREEKDGLPNDLSDSFVYVHNHCRHLWYIAPKPPYTIPTEQQHRDELTKRLINKNKPAGFFNDYYNNR
jgi:Terminase RNaseH-like domain